MKVLRNTAFVVAATSLLASAVQASGWGTEGVNPGGALFNDKSFVVQGVLGYVAPDRNYTDATTTLNPGTLTAADTNVGQKYLVLSGDLKFAVNEEIDCALRGHRPYHNDTTADSNWLGATYSLSTQIDSLGVDGTCSYKFDVADGHRVRLIGGFRSTDLQIDRTNILSAAAGASAGATNAYNLEGDRVFGYRIGASYEIPQYALRAQVIYDSERDMDLSGTQTVNGTTVAPAMVSITLPKAISARLQSGINETTLVYGGVRWTEWSAIQSLSVTGGVPVSVTTGYKDAFTVEAGVQKKLTEDLAGSLSITWNEGIGGGYTDSWSFAAGVAYDLDENWRVSVGGSATYLTSSSGEGGTLGGATVSYNQANDWAYAAAVRLQYAID